MDNLESATLAIGIRGISRLALETCSCLSGYFAFVACPDTGCSAGLSYGPRSAVSRCGVLCVTLENAAQHRVLRCIATCYVSFHEVK